MGIDEKLRAADAAIDRLGGVRWDEPWSIVREVQAALTELSAAVALLAQGKDVRHGG